MNSRLCCSIAFLLLLAQASLAQVPSKPGDWPQWRGPDREGVSTERGLLKEWPKDGPTMVWQVDTVGVAYSSISVKDGRIYTQGDLNGIEHVICLSVEDGSVIWAVQPEPVAKALDERVAREFGRMDRNRDGKVDEAEALSRIGWNFNNFDTPGEGGSTDPAKVAAERAGALFKAIDGDGDGSLSFTEGGRLFRDYFQRVDQPDTNADEAALAKDRAAAFMKELDKDGDGKLERNDTRGSALYRAFSRADQRDPKTRRGDSFVTAAELEAYLGRYEKGKDGRVSRAELESYYAKNHPGADGVLDQKELRGYYGGYRNSYGDGPRGTPTVDGHRVYAEGGNGDLTCLDAATGKTIWHRNLQADLGGRRPGWGYSESPLVEGEHLIVTPGDRKGTIAALNKITGEVVWRSEGTRQGAQYSSPVAAEIGGIRQIVQFARTSVFGIDAKDGRFLWEYTKANNRTANCCTPLVYKDHVFASSSYGAGGGLVKIDTDGSTQSAEEVYFEKKIANHHGGIVRVGQVMYSLGSGTLLCMDFLTGKIMWQHRSIGKGSLVVADGMLYLQSERNQVALAEATPEGYRERGRFRIPSRGRPSWAHPVVAGGRLYIRDQGYLTAYDVRAQ